MSNNNLDTFEQDILCSVENDEWYSWVVISMNDYNNYKVTWNMQRKSIERALPYQNIIQMLVHQYANNKIYLDV